MEGTARAWKMIGGLMFEWELKMQRNGDNCPDDALQT